LEGRVYGSTKNRSDQRQLEGAAGALKELVSNSYDAGARQVTVTTGWPTLREIVITDNGRGMTTPEFEDIVRHIGFSNKNLGDEILVPRTRVKRRTIGHYGIGLLAVGQLASVMRVTSKTAGTVEGFTAEIDFEQFEQVREDGIGAPSAGHGRPRAQNRGVPDNVEPL